MTLSVVVPAYNEAESLGELAEELLRACAAYDAEFIVVDDGSTDGTWAAIRELSARDPRFRGVRFRRNFGKAAALAAGFAKASGDVVATLDADLQDDPAELPRLLAELDAGKDLVVGWKRKRRDPFHKTLPSRVFNGMVGALTGVRLHDHNSGFKALRGEAAKRLVLYGDRHRFLPVLAHVLGYAVGEIPVNHRPRKFGASKYGFGRFLRGFLDLLAVSFLCRYRARPMHFFGTVGLLAIAAAIGGWGLSFAWPGAAALAWWSAGVAPLAFGFGLVAELSLERAGGAAVPYVIAEETAATTA